MAQWIHQRARISSILVLFVGLIQATSQEIWVAVDNRLQSTSGQEILVPGARYLSGLAIQDDPLGSIYWTTDAGKEGAGLYRVQKNGLSSLVYQDPEATYFESVAYSPATQSIYLTSPSTNSILRVNNKQEVKRVLYDQNKKPSGLVYDPCSRSLFWTNTARGGATIEVLEEVEAGTEAVSRVLVSGNMTRPRGLALDSPEGMLYWTDQVKNEFTIWRADVSGGKSLVCRGRGSEPFSLAVTGHHIYWSDWASHALYRVEKRGNCSLELVSRFKSSKPSGLTAAPGGQHSCDQRTANHSQDPSQMSVPTSDVIISETTVVRENGTDSDMSAEKRCGSPWEYYCLQASPCLEVEGLPLCLCPPGWEGDRCELEKASSSNLLLPLSREKLELVVVVLGPCSLLLLSSTIILSILLYRFRKRPRIVRKRFISVARDSKKDLSLGGGSSSNSCGLALEEGIQLDIENCCNMTLCDTPCFEPPSRVPKDLAACKTNSSNKTCSPRKQTKTDRRALLTAKG